jgi:flagellar hook protein FlgE
MMRSLYSGVSGLKIHQTKMDVIGNNISNVNTVAFKSNSVTFSEVFYQTTQSASGSNSETGKGGTNAKQIGLGASVASISTNTNEGAAQRTDNAFDLKISGDAYFVVSSNGSQVFTRAGNFTIDDAGNLVTSDGGLVMGWQVRDGEVIKDTVSALSPKSAEFRNTAPEATTDFTVTGNLNKEDANFAAGESVPMSIRFYDSLGYEYNATINVEQIPSNDINNPTNTYVLSMGDIYCNGNLTNLTGNVTLGTQPTASGTASTATLGFDPTTGNPIQSNTGDDEEYKFVINLWTQDQDAMGLTNDDEAWDAVTKVISTIDPVTVDYSQLVSRASETSFSSSFGDPSGKGAGKAVGTLEGLSVQDDGKIIGNYSNGDVKTLGQIAVASFFNPAGLEKVGDNYYRATMNSGLFNGIGDDITAVGGSITSGVLEMSNVDLANEFTEMITTQRGFQANSRIITVSDTLIEELVNLKR